MILTEIPKTLNIVMKINSLVFFILSILYIGFLDVLLSYISLPVFDKLYSLSFSAILLVFGIFFLLVSYRDNKIQIRLLFEIIITWQIALVISSFSAIQFVSSWTSPPPIIIVWVTDIIMIGLLVINIIVYRKYR